METRKEPGILAKNHKSIRGDSLIAALVGIALVAIAMSGVCAMMRSGSRAARGLASLGEIDDLQRVLSLSTANKSTCDAIIKGKVFDPTPSKLSAQSIAGLSVTGVNGEIIASAGMILNYAQTISDMKLVDFKQVAKDVNGLDRYVAALVVTTSQAEGLGRVRRVSLGIEAKATSATQSVIQGCFDPSAPGAATWVALPAGATLYGSAPTILTYWTSTVTTPNAYCQSLGHKRATQACRFTLSANGRTYAAEGTLVANNWMGPTTWAWSCQYGGGDWYLNPADSQIECE